MTPYFDLLRPPQWVKNSFLLLPLIFCGALRSDHWRESIVVCLAGIVCFCCWSSCAYILNDFFDRKKDRLHPRKRLRPIASGAVSPQNAALVGMAAFLVPFGILALIALWEPESFALKRDGTRFLAVGGLYLANNLLYNLFLRSRILLDVASIAIGFLLRLLGGCYILNVAPSVWLLVCGFSLALLLGLSKRRLELDRLEREGGEQYRQVLIGYTRPFLNRLIALTTAATLLSYVLYTISPGTIAIQHTNKLLITSPFVFFGVFRYLYDVYQGQADGPVEIVLSDGLFLLNGALWTAFVLYLILK